MLHASVSHKGGRYGELVFVGVDRFGPTRLNRVTFILDFHDGNYWPMSVHDALEIVFGAPVIQYFDEEDSVRLIVTVVLTAPLRNAEGFVNAKASHLAKIIFEQIPLECDQDDRQCAWDAAGGPEYYAFRGQLDAYERHKAHCDCYK